MSTPALLKPAADTRLHIRVPAKLNLFLHVTGRRPDGYHLLESVFCPINLYDHLSLALSEESDIRLEGGLPGVATQDDLTVRAARALLTACRSPLGAAIRLEKHIPAGAGLGGGSADAAYTLLGLNHLLGTPLSPGELASIAVRLGADVPFFLGGQPAFVSGIGEQLEPIAIPELPVVVIKPPVHMPTARIFSSPDLTRDSSTVKMSVFGFSDDCERIAFIAGQTSNTLQAVAIHAAPAISQALDLFGHMPDSFKPSWFRMTGSGSAVFGVFRCDDHALHAAEWVRNRIDTAQTAQPDGNVGAVGHHSHGESWFVWHGHTRRSATLENQLVQQVQPSGKTR